MTNETLNTAIDTRHEIERLKRSLGFLEGVIKHADSGINIELETAGYPSASVQIRHYSSKGLDAITAGFMASLKAELTNTIADLEKQLAAL